MEARRGRRPDAETGRNGSIARAAGAARGALGVFFLRGTGNKDKVLTVQSIAFLPFDLVAESALYCGWVTYMQNRK